MSGERFRLARPGLVLVALVAALAALSVGPAAHPTPVRAGTAANMESKILGWINDARENRGLRPLRSATSFATSPATGHRRWRGPATSSTRTASGCLLENRDISFDSCGEVIAYTT